MRVAHVCTAAIVFVVIALAPASAGAHPRDCAITGAWSPEPVAVWFADGPAAGCMTATAVRSYDTPDARAGFSARRRQETQARPLPGGRPRAAHGTAA